MIRRVILVFLIFSIASCRENKISYEFLVFRNNNIKMWSDRIPVRVKSEIENGDFLIDDEQGNIIAQGTFNNSLKTGEWIYHPSDTQVVKIEWTSYINPNKMVTINYPLNWKIHESDKRPFQASFYSESKTDKDKFFIIIPQSKDSIGMDLENYWRYYTSTAFDYDTVKEYAFFKFETTSGNNFYFSRYILVRNEEEILVLSFLGEIGSTIYDITYSSLYEDYERKHIIFFDMLRSLCLENKRFFSPFDPVKKFQQMEKPLHTLSNGKTTTQASVEFAYPWPSKPVSEFAHLWPLLSVCTNNRAHVEFSLCGPYERKKASQYAGFFMPRF